MILCDLCGKQYDVGGWKPVEYQCVLEECQSSFASSPVSRTKVERIPMATIHLHESCISGFREQVHNLKKASPS